MIGWYHRLNGHEFEQAPGDGEGEGSLACCSPWGRKELDMTEGLNNSNLASCTRGKTEETRRTTVPQAHEGKPQSQKVNQNEKAKNYIPGEGTRQNRKKNN